jgi:hypothetical protein
MGPSLEDVAGGIGAADGREVVEGPAGVEAGLVSDLPHPAKVGDRRVLWRELETDAQCRHAPSDIPSGVSLTTPMLAGQSLPRNEPSHMRVRPWYVLSWTFRSASSTEPAQSMLNLPL